MKNLNKLLDRNRPLVISCIFLVNTEVIYNVIQFLTRGLLLCAKSTTDSSISLLILTKYSYTKDINIFKGFMFFNFASYGFSDL